MKKALLLLHGYSHSCELDFEGLLSEANFEDYEVINHNIDGHFNESSFEYKKTFLKLDKHMQELLNTYSSVSIIGFSMGRKRMRRRSRRKKGESEREEITKKKNNQ